jgi:hypothetical protein
MADRSLEIEIEIAQLKQTIAGLQEAASATVKGTEANVAHGKSVLELVEHTRGFHKVLHGITEESPLAGLALHAAFSGPGAAVAALIIAVHALRKAQEEAKKAAEEHAVEVTKAYFEAEGSISKAVDTIHDARVAHEEWVKSLTDGSHKIRDELDLDIAKLHAVVEAQKEVAKAQGREVKEIPGAVQGEELRLTQAAISRVKSQLGPAALAEASASAAAESGMATAGPIQDSIQKQIQKAQQEAAESAKKTAGDGPTLMQRLFGSVFSKLPMMGGFLPGGFGVGGTAPVGGESSEEVKRLQDEAAKQKAAQDELNKAAAEHKKTVTELTTQLNELTKAEARLKLTASIAAMGGAMAGETQDPLMGLVARGSRAMDVQPLIASGRAGPSPLYMKTMKELMDTTKALHDDQIIPLLMQAHGDIAKLAELYQRLKSEQAARMKGLLAP